MELSVQREAISKGSSSSDDSLEPTVQRHEEWWMPNGQPAASHNVQDTTGPFDLDTSRHVPSYALEDTSSNFDTTITANSLTDFWEASPAKLANDTNTSESEDFDTWLKAFGASPNIEDGLMEPGLSEIPFFPMGDNNTTFTGDLIGEDHPHVNTIIADSPSAPKLIPACSGLDDSERSNGFGTKYQLVGKLASAAIARFMPRQRRTTDKKHSMVPATEPKRRRQRSHPLEKGKIKKFRMLGTCFRCHAYTETYGNITDPVGNFVCESCKR